MFGLRVSQEPLLSFDKVQSLLRARNYSFQGLQQIPLDSVVGSEGRYGEFARDFRPQPQHRARLQRVAQTGGDLPIEVFQIDQVYFIRDGHHRVALARSRGDQSISALVTQITVRAPITPELDNQEVLLRASLSHFLQETNLDRHCPETDFRLEPPELYQSLRQHIEVHQYYLGTTYQREFSYTEAAASWHDLIYRPVLKILQECGAMSEFPRRSEAELYLWMTYHREEFRCRGQYQSDAQVALALVQRFSERPLKGWMRLIQRIWKAAWSAAREAPVPPAHLQLLQAKK